ADTRRNFVCMVARGSPARAAARRSNAFASPGDRHIIVRIANSFSCELPRALHQRLQKLAAERGNTMSYRAFKRLLGETSLERKCRFLFGAVSLLLITGSFWFYAWRTEHVAYDQLISTSQLLVDPVVAQQIALTCNLKEDTEA